MPKSTLTAIVCLILPFLLSVNIWSQKPEVVVSTGHTDAIFTVDISKDGKWLATGSADKLVKILHNATGKELRTLSGNDGRTEYVRFNDKATHIGAFLSSGALKFWNVETGEVTSNIKGDGHFAEFDYVLNDSKVFFLDEGGYPAIFDYKSGGEKTRFEIPGVTRLKAGLSGKWGYAYDYKGVMRKFAIEGGEVVAERSLFDEFTYSPARMDVSADGKYLAAVFNENEIHIISTKDLSTVRVMTGHSTRIKDIKFDERDPILFSLEHGNKAIFEWDVRLGKLSRQEVAVDFGAQWIETHPKEPVLVVADFKALSYVNRRNLKVIKRFESKTHQIMNMAYDQKGKYLAAASAGVDVKLWDLEQNKIVRNFQGFWPVAIDPTGKYLLSNFMSIKIAVWDIETGEKIKELPTEGDLIQKIQFSPDGKLVAGIGLRGVVRIWDMETNETIQKIEWPAGMTYGLCFSPDGKWLAASGLGNDFYVWEVSTGKEVVHKEGFMLMISELRFAPDGSWLAGSCWDKKVYLYNTADWSEIGVLEGHVNTIHAMDVSPDGKYLATGAGNNAVWEADNSIIVWDVASRTEVCRYNGHLGGVNKVIFDKTAPLIYSCANDGMIKAWNYLDCDEVGTFISVNKTDYVISTPDFYYMASRDALDAVSFRMGKDLFPFDQFDLRLNRPDIVASRLGKTPQGLVNAYKYVYKKRLRKMKFKEEDLAEDFHLPELQVLTEDIPLITKEAKLKFNIIARDEKYTLDRINVYVNDVPINGLKGISVKKEALHEVKYELEVDLMAQDNKIQVSVLNSAGVESLRQTFTIVRDQESNTGDLYLVTIGVSDYQDDRFKLTYPVKDARDMAGTFEQSQDIYHNVHSKVLIDSAVTAENIRGLRTYLSQARPEDAVILFVAGHGVLDEEFNYYFGTYDMDFDAPEQRGLAYEELDALLLDTKALRKLLIMDTCHSGEVDKEEVEAVNEVETEIGDVEFRSAGQGVRKKEAFGLYNSVELMETMFTDIRKGSGANVISSAGGAEFAMESDQWKNGLFTYCLLRGLQAGRADLNRDSKIVISELKQYVYKEVNSLSQGKQRPTSREENISLDYRVW